MRILKTLSAALVLLFPTRAFADYSLVNAVVDSVGGTLPYLIPGDVCAGSDACGFVQLAQIIVDRFRPMFTVVAILVLVIFGYRMIVGQEEDVIGKSRAVVSGTIAGLIMVWLIDPFIHAFYGFAGEVPQGAMEQGVAVLTVEVSGLINWVLVIVAALAITMLIVTALKSITTESTGEEGIAHLRKTLFSIAFGIVLLALRFVLSQGFVETTTDPSPILAEALAFVSYLMGFLALAAVIVVLYAGFQCVLSMGSEENFTHAKSLLARAAIGAVVIIVSLALVNFVILPGI